VRAAAYALVMGWHLSRAQDVMVQLRS